MKEQERLDGNPNLECINLHLGKTRLQQWQAVADNGMHVPRCKLF